MAGAQVQDRGQCVFTYNSEQNTWTVAQQCASPSLCAAGAPAANTPATATPAGEPAKAKSFTLHIKDGGRVEFKKNGKLKFTHKLLTKPALNGQMRLKVAAPGLAIAADANGDVELDLKAVASASVTVQCEH